MDKWKLCFNEPYIGNEIKQINNVVLPKQYLEFMKSIMVVKVILVKHGLNFSPWKICRKLMMIIVLRIFA